MKNILIIALSLTVAVLLWILLNPEEDYYEYTATEASACLAGELYDEEAQVCYFDYYCESDEECAEVDARYGELLTALADEYQSQQHAYGHPPEGGEVEVEPAENAAIRPSSDHEPRTIKGLMGVLLPVADAARIVQYQKNSDGTDGILAYVEPASADGTQWTLGYDPVDSFEDDGSLKNPRQLMATLIHEYMHIVSLNDTQVKHVSPDVEYIECETGQVILNEGCAVESAYLTKFIAAFWDEATREEAYQALIEEREGDFSYENYDRNPSAFVTEYAATNAVEDIAESFAMFVMRDRKDSPETLAEQKVDFFYSFPELVQLRKHMRGGVAKVLGNI